MIRAVLHVFDTTGAEGAVGNTTKFLVSEQPDTGGAGVVYVAVKHPAAVGVNKPALVIVPAPPLTVHVPPAAPPD